MISLAIGLTQFSTIIAAMVLFDTGHKSKPAVEQIGLHKVTVTLKGVNLLLHRNGRGCEIVMNTGEIKSLVHDLSRASRRLCKLLPQSPRPTITEPIASTTTVSILKESL